MIVEIFKYNPGLNLGPFFLSCETPALRDCICMSEQVYVGTIKGEFVCLWGLIPPCVMSNQAYLWLTTSERVKEHQFLFVRHSQRIVEEILKEFPVIVGHCHVSAERSIRWIKWLGGTFGEMENMRVPFQILRRH